MLTPGVLVTALALGFFSPQLASDPTSWPIYGGDPVPEGQWPEVVAVRAGDLLCTGTLISPQVVLTAAHCFAHASTGSSVEVYKGSTLDLSDPSVEPIGVSTDWAGHPAYCGMANCKDASYDYGYITLNKPVELGHFPAVIATQDEWDDLMTIGRTVWLIGFGETETGTSGEKRIVDSSIASFTPKGLQFFTAGGGKDSCRGDSGGPALVASNDGTRWLLAGVLSSGAVQCGEGGYYGVPIAVLDWLVKKTPYRVPSGACTDLNCLDTVPHEEKSSSQCASTTSGTSAVAGAFGLFALGLLQRRRAAKGA